MFIYQNTCEPVGQIYVTETCSDIALGVSTQILWLVILVESLFTETLMNSALKPHGVFFLFGFFSACAVVFEYFYVKETKGLLAKEKKELYCPENLKNNKIDDKTKVSQLNDS